MSNVGRYAGTIEIGKGQPWAKDVRCWADRALTQAVPLAAGSAELRRRGGATSTPAEAVSLTVDNGRIQLVENVCGLRLSQADVDDLPAGDYDLVVTMTDQDGRSRQVRGQLRVVA